ncbi:Zn-dependent hydrolase [Campylobacter sp. 19-13652]|uniref:Zn-dependent hydrolase n=1 Tax=Campylobacter sp. 19-13652 TaxID=2840180 RepID=UPI001C7414DD|nr:Zn-dependent hydrolase [Campylobacter sp. 19-13652]BCX79376.1 putative hydrolase [Campylobacter sp. 19-13652]
MNADRLSALFKQINSISDDSMGAGINRLAYSAHDKKAREVFKQECENAGLLVRQDAVGNIFARRSGACDGLPAVLFGSHLDTVINGGEFDGTLGVLAGLEVIRSLNDEGIITRRPLELVVFACEESSRFNVSTLGSKVLTKKLNKDKFVKLRDYKDMSICDIFSEFGLDAFRACDASEDFSVPHCFFELHIEQGPVLEKEGLDVGVVSAISAPFRFCLEITGAGAHSGTTAMKYRQDALCAGAEMVLLIEHVAKDMADCGVVATVGDCRVHPGVMNVVPGCVKLLVDLRGISLKSRQEAYERIINLCVQVASERGVKCVSKELSSDDPVSLDDGMIDLICKNAKSLGLSHKVMPSGAGHDSMHMADICKTGMIFVPSRSGISHNPAEYTDLSYICAGTRLLRSVVLEAANE